MSAFDDILAADGLNAFAGSEFGETVRYHGDTGARDIQAVVNRTPPRKPDENPDTVTPHFLVSVANDAEDGVSRDEFNDGLNRMDIARTQGLGPDYFETFSIVSVESEDAGMLVLKVR